MTLSLISMDTVAKKSNPIHDDNEDDDDEDDEDEEEDDDDDASSSEAENVGKKWTL